MNQFGGLQAFEQLYGDCYAHVSTTVILKLLKTLGIVDDVRNIKDKDQTYINDLAILITPIIFVIMVYLIQIIRVSLEPLDLILIILMLIGIAISMRFHKKI